MIDSGNWIGQHQVPLLLSFSSSSLFIVIVVVVVVIVVVIIIIAAIVVGPIDDAVDIFHCFCLLLLSIFFFDASNFPDLRCSSKSRSSVSLLFVVRLVAGVAVAAV